MGDGVDEAFSKDGEVFGFDPVFDVTLAHLLEGAFECVGIVEVEGDVVQRGDENIALLRPIGVIEEGEEFWGALKERGIEWYTMSWCEGEKEDVKLLEKCN